MDRYRKCSRCGNSYHKAFFRVERSLYASSESGRHTACIGCEQTGRDTVKRENRFVSKARDSLRRHADKYILHGLARSREEFSERFGWDIGRMAHDAEHAYSNGCCYCEEKFISMGHGLSDITLDIINPAQPPYYGTNTKWACQTCNRRKGKLSPEDWGAQLVEWRRWQAWQIRLHANPLAGLELFDWAISNRTVAG